MIAYPRVVVQQVIAVCMVSVNFRFPNLIEAFSQDNFQAIIRGISVEKFTVGYHCLNDHDIAGHLGESLIP